MFGAQNGCHVERLFNGDISAYNDDWSRADLALCGHLAFWTGKDPVLMDRLFRQSRLMRPKWDELRGAQPYGEMTIQKAIAATSDTYTPPRRLRAAQRAGLSRAASRARTSQAPAGQLEDFLALLQDAAWDGNAGAIFNAVPLLASLSATDYGKAKAAVKEKLSRRLSLRDLDRAVEEHRLQQSASVPDTEGLPAIVVTDRPLRDTSDDALHALDVANTPPSLFVRCGQLVRARADENGRWTVEPLNEASLRGHLTRIANFHVLRSGGPTHTLPPVEVVRDLLVRGDWPFPPLEGITDVPVVRHDGTVLADPGYDPATRLIYAPAADLETITVTDSPSDRDVVAARKLLFDTIIDFPFVDDGSKANLIALALTPLLRPAIDGPVPLALIDAPQAGTGKSLLAEVVTCITTGRGAGMMTPAKSEDEWRKRLTSQLMLGARVIVIDNVDEPLGSGNLAAALTTSEWEDRVLKTNDIVRLPQRATWIATGNNLRLRGDLARRSYRIGLDAREARPWERGEFRHPNLREWVRENRALLLIALLTLVRAWYAAGKPSVPVRALGSFEAWSRAMAGILEHAGVTGFLCNQDSLYEEADEEAVEWEDFIRQWGEEIGEDKAVSTFELTRRLTASERLRECLPGALSEKWEQSNGGFERALGKALARRNGCTFPGGFRLEKARSNSVKGKPQWWVVHVSPAAPPVSPISSF